MCVCVCVCVCDVSSQIEEKEIFSIIGPTKWDCMVVVVVVVLVLCDFVIMHFQEKDHFMKNLIFFTKDKLIIPSN